MKILELMRVHVVRTVPTATLGEVVDLLDLYQVTLIPVVDEEGRPVGVVSESDVAGRLLFGAAEAAGPLSGWMTAPAICLDEHEDLEAARALMRDRGLKRIPVTSEGRLVGMVSRVDVFQALLEGAST
jgi:CBS domain-containing protein